MSFPTREEMNSINYTKPLKIIDFTYDDFIKPKDIFSTGRRKHGIPLSFESPIETTQFKIGEKISIEQLMKYCYIKPIHNWGKVKTNENSFDVVGDVYVNGIKSLSIDSGIISNGNSINSFIYVKKEYIDENSKITTNIYQRSYISEYDLDNGDINGIEFLPISNESRTVKYTANYIDDFSSINDLLFIIKEGMKYQHVDVNSKVISVIEPEDRQTISKTVYTSDGVDLTEINDDDYYFTFNYNIKEDTFVGLVNKRFYLGLLNRINSLNSRDNDTKTYEYITRQLSKFDPKEDNVFKISNNMFNLLQNPYQLKIFVGGYRLIAGIHYSVLPYSAITDSNACSIAVHVDGLFTKEKIEMLTSSNYRSKNDRNYIFKVNNDLRIVDNDDIQVGSNVPGIIDMYRYFKDNMVNLNNKYVMPLDHDGVIIYSNGQLLKKDVDYITHNNFQIEFININYINNNDNYIEIVCDIHEEIEFDMTRDDFINNVDLPSELTTSDVNVMENGLNSIIKKTESIEYYDIINMNGYRLDPYNGSDDYNNLYKNITLKHNSDTNVEVLDLEGISLTLFELDDSFINYNKTDTNVNNLSNFTSNKRNNFNDNEFALVNNHELELVHYDGTSDSFKKTRFDDNYKEISSFKGKESNSIELSLREKMITIIGSNKNKTSNKNRDITSNGKEVLVDGQWVGLDSKNYIANSGSLTKRGNNLNKLKTNISNINNHVDVQLGKLKEKIKTRFDYNNSKYNILDNNIFVADTDVKDSHSYLLIFNDTDESITTKFRYIADVFDFNIHGFSGDIKENVILQEDSLTVLPGEYEVILPYVYNMKKSGLYRKNVINDDMNVSFELDNKDLKIIVGR